MCRPDEGGNSYCRKSLALPIWAGNKIIEFSKISWFGWNLEIFGCGAA
jgi:hypothetical protein